jgi:hypothetical protein
VKSECCTFSRASSLALDFMETLSEYLVRHRKSLKHFSALHGDYLQQKRAIEMSTPTSSNSLNTSGSAPVKIQTGPARDMFLKPVSPSTEKQEGKFTQGMGINSPVTVGPIKPVDRRTIEGSTPGDFRAQASPAVLPDSPAPREGMCQSKVTSSKLDYPAPVVTVTAETAPTSEVE